MLDVLDQATIQLPAAIAIKGRQALFDLGLKLEQSRPVAGAQFFELVGASGRMRREILCDHLIENLLGRYPSLILANERAPPILANFGKASRRCKPRHDRDDLSHHALGGRIDGFQNGGIRSVSVGSRTRGQ